MIDLKLTLLISGVVIAAIDKQKNSSQDRDYQISSPNCNEACDNIVHELSKCKYTKNLLECTCSKSQAVHHQYNKCMNCGDLTATKYGQILNSVQKLCDGY